MRGQPFGGICRNILKIEGGYVYLIGKFPQLVEITPIGAKQRRNLSRAGVLLTVNDEKAMTERSSGKREHACQLSAPQNADGCHNYSCLGSG